MAASKMPPCGFVSVAQNGGPPGLPAHPKAPGPQGLMRSILFPQPFCLLRLWQRAGRVAGIQPDGEAKPLPLQRITEQAALRRRRENGEPFGTVQVFCSQTCYLPVKVKPTALRVFPVHGAAVFRLGDAGQTGLIAVKDTGRAGEEHLKHHRQPHPSLIASTKGQKTADIVTVQQVQLGAQIGFRVAQHHIGHPGGKASRVDAAQGKEVPAMAAEIVVHHRVQQIVPQPVPGVLPHLPDKHTIGGSGLHRPAKDPPELLGYLIGHIQPPAVYPEFFHPVAAHLCKIGLHLRIGGVQLGHFRHIGEAGVIGVALLVQPGTRWRNEVIPVKIGRRRTTLQHVLEGKKAGTAMVEHPVQHHPHPHFVGLLNESAQVIVGAEAGVHMVIVDGVVFVVALCGEDRIQIQAVTPQPGNVLQIFRHAPQCAAQPPATLRRAGQRLGAVCEAVREDVVKTGGVHPLGWPVDLGAQDGRVLKVFAAPVYPVFLHLQVGQFPGEDVAVIIGPFLLTLQAKIVTKAGMTDGKDRLEKVESLIPGNAFHGQALKADRSGLTGPVCHIQFAADQIPAPSPQPHAEGLLVQGIGIL